MKIYVTAQLILDHVYFVLISSKIVSVYDHFMTEYNSMLLFHTDVIVNQKWRNKNIDLI